MRRINYQERYAELYQLFQQLLSDHRQALERLGELRAENEILLGILKEHGIKLPPRHVNF